MQNEEREAEEKLREVSCIGDAEAAISLVKNGTNINAQNNLNGWTALHWAAKRGHTSVVEALMSEGAKTTLKDNNGLSPADVAVNENIRSMLGGELNGSNPSPSAVKEDVAFTPSYLAHPPFPYASIPTAPRSMEPPNLMSMKLNDNHAPGRLPASSHYASGITDIDELVIKIRIAKGAEPDFIEVELDRKRLTYENLMSTMCSELQVNRTLVQKIRKIPDTVVRKDKDVRRFHDFQELELVLTNKTMSESSRNYHSAVSPRHVDVVY
eukprot:GHVO01031994.1.p1 GENE.GHVO01031994.1~~GHVO01031994.1.p1  ORF type:complete len:268 (-),score=33.53 GHVO01031994.1:84-887(-)